MNLLTVGLSHRSASVRQLEQAAVTADDVPKFLTDLLRAETVQEAVVVSTCNRVEVYVVAESFHGGLDDITSVLARYAGTEVTDLTEHMYVYYAGAAVEHLFSVAAGLDSMVVGESQILGQLRQAYQVAQQTDTVGKTLHELVQHALRVGKRVHSETNIDAEGASVVSEALADADAALEGLTGRRALLVGAGSMGALAAAQLNRAGIGEVLIANRTVANGRRLAESLSADGTAARTIDLAELGSALTTADLVVTCTGSVGAVICADVVSEALAARGEAPLLFCDLGLPRDTAPEVSDLPGVTVVDLETLQRRLTDQVGGSESERAGRIVSDEVHSYVSAQRSAEVTPTVTALRERAAEVVDAELLRLDSRLPDLDSGVHEELTRTVRRVVDKLLHAPTVRVKQLASEPGGSGYADALRELFELDPRNPAVIGSPRTTEGSSVAQAQAGSPTRTGTQSHSSSTPGPVRDGQRDRTGQDGEDR